MLQIDNDGPDLVATNYWDSEQAGAGLCYLSGNAGTWRLLVPDAAAGELAEMRTGFRAALESSRHMPGECWDVVFDDGSDAPYSIAIDKRQCDRVPKAGPCRLAVWTRQGRALELACEVRV